MFASIFYQNKNRYSKSNLEFQTEGWQKACSVAAYLCLLLDAIFRSENGNHWYDVSINHFLFTETMPVDYGSAGKLVLIDDLQCFLDYKIQNKGLFFEARQNRI